MGAVVAHHPQVPVGNRDRPEIPSLTRGIVARNALVDVRLGQRLAVHPKPLFLGQTLYGLATDRDYPLHEVVFVRRDQADDGPESLKRANNRIVGSNGFVLVVPGLGSLEHDHIPRLRIPESIADSVDEDLVSRAAGASVKCRFHGLRRDQKDASDEVLNDNTQDKCDDNEDQNLTPQWTFPRVIGHCRFSGVGRVLVGVGFRHTPDNRWRNQSSARYESSRFVGLSVG